MSEKKKPLTPEELSVCANLRRIWDAKKKELDLSQQKAAELLGITQGAVSHQLQGRNALHTDAIIKWAEILKCKESDIDPNRKYAAGGNTPQIEREFSELMERVGPGNHKAVMAMIRSFVGQLEKSDD